MASRPRGVIRRLAACFFVIEAPPANMRLDYVYYAPTSLVFKQQGLLERALTELYSTRCKRILVGYFFGPQGPFFCVEIATVISRRSSRM